METSALHPNGSARIGALVLACVVLAAGGLIAGVGAGVAGGDPATAPGTIDVDGSTIGVNQSETAAIDLTVPDGETRQVTIGSADGPLHAVATVTDATGNGSVTLLLDVSEITDEYQDAEVRMGSHRPEDAMTVAGEDDLEDVAVHETPATWALPAGDYDVAVGPTGEPSDTAVLAVTPDVSLDQDEPMTVEPGEVVRVSGDTALEPGDGLRVSVRSTGTAPFLAINDTTVDADRTFASTLTVPEVADGSEFRLLVIHDGTEKATVPGVVQGEPIRDDDDAELSIDHDGDELGLDAEPGQTITGTTDLDPETRLDVGIRTEPTAPEPFGKHRATDVDDDGSFGVTFDLSAVAESSPVTVEVTPIGTTSESVAVPGVVHASSDRETATDGERTPTDSGTGDADSGDDHLGGPALSVVGALVALLIVIILTVYR